MPFFGCIEIGILAVNPVWICVIFSVQLCQLLMISTGIVFNSFILLSFEKMVILEVSMMGAVNMALRPDVKRKIV